MRKNLIYSLLTLFYLFGHFGAQSQTQDFIGTTNFHETIRDVANMSNNRQVFVGSKSVNWDGTNAIAFLFVKDNTTNNILWTRTIDMPLISTDEVLTRVRVLNNGDIMAMGYYGFVAGYAATRGLLARYSATGTLIWSRSYLINIPGIPSATNPINNGTMFYDFDVNPANDSLYVCGTSDFKPGDARSYIASINATNGNLIWQTDVNCIGSSDNFTSVVYQNGLLYATGFANVGLTFDDAILYCVNAFSGGIQWGRNISFLSLNNANGGTVSDNVPLQIYVNPNNTFLIAGVTQDSYGAGLAQVSFTLQGQYSNSGNLTNIQGYSYRSPILANTYENHSRILPSDATLNNFYLIQSPSSSLSGSVADTAVANRRDSKISFITNLNTLNWSRQFIDSGQQGIFGMTMNGTDLTLAGNSLNSPYSIGSSSIRDGYIIQTPLPIPLINAGSCQIKSDSLVINPLTNISISNYTNIMPALIFPPIPNLFDAPDSLLRKSACATCIDSNTIVISSDSTLTKNTIFAGKYFIAANVTLTVAPNISLDITNCDMSFGPCAGIRFGINSLLRANNSVFRPCIMTDTWKGLTFDHSAKSIIDECTFKNASIAVNAISTDIKFNNNYIQNCWHGLDMVSVPEYKSPTTDNNFVLDVDFNKLVFCDQYTSTNSNPKSIFIDRTIVTGDISHNTFTVNTQSDLTAQAIYETSSNVRNIALNHFTNTGNGIVVLNSIVTGLDFKQLISSNDFVNENVQQGTTYSALDLQDASDVEIVNNRLTNLSNSMVNGNGINVIKSTQIVIDNNIIQGFSNSIGIEGSDNIFINNNNLSQALQNGILAITSRQIMIKCNEIDLNHHDGAGIVIDGYDNFEVFTNCIFNTVTAIKIDVIASGNPSTNVKIYNNYLYNYKHAGIENSGAPSLMIGTSANFGQNTFWSNRNSSTFDVLTNGLGMTIMYNNYNVNNISTGTMILQNYQMFSTASCANQIEGNPGPNDGNYKDIFNCENTKFVDMDIKPSKFASFDPFSKYTYGEYFLFMDQIKTESGLFSSFISKINQDNMLTNEQKTWLSLYANIQLNHIEQAKDLFTELSASTIEDPAQFMVFTYLYGHLINVDYNAFTSKYVSVLVANYKNEEINRNIIYQILKGQVEEADLYFVDYSLSKNTASNSLVKISSGENNMTIYPNPVKDELNMIFSTTNNYQNTLLIYNAMGELVYSQPIVASSGKVSIQLSQLHCGNYFAVLKNADNVQHFKFTKE